MQASTTALATVIHHGRRPVPALAADERGFAYGDGLFETMRVHAGHVPWWEAHLSRLAHGAARLRLPMPDARWLAEIVAPLLRAAPPSAVLKLVLARGGGGRGYAAAIAAEPTLLLALHAPPPPSPTALTLRWCALRVAVQPALAGIKHLNRLEQVLARAEWDDPDVHEGLLLDSDGAVAGATAANVFARIDGRWCTPPVDRRGVAGICRAWVLAAADAREQELSRAQVEQAEAVFLCNAVRGILPVASLGDRRWAPHPAIDVLRTRLAQDQPAFAIGS